MNSLLNTLPLVLPIAHAWAEKQQIIILQEGTPLTESERADALWAGVAHPEKIRVVRAEIVPHPESEDLMFLARQMGLFGTESSGLAIGYGICLPPKVWENRYRLVHECVHVAQHEKYQGIRPFLNAYLRECIDPGYPFGHLEQEAIRVAKDICKASAPLPAS
jgi:hypothetical protein